MHYDKNWIRFSVAFQNEENTGLNGGDNILPVSLYDSNNLSSGVDICNQFDKAC